MPSIRPSTADKRKTFRELHKSGCFVIPNPWNVGSARYLQGLGFKALATTSSGHAHSRGLPDGAQTHGRGAGALSRTGGGNRHSAQRRLRGRLRRRSGQGRGERDECIATGVAGLSIEDSPAVADAALRVRRGAGPRQGGARGDRQGRRRCGVHRANREFHPRPARHRRDDPAAQGVRRCRRRLSLFARHPDPRAHRGDRKAVGGKAINFLNYGALGFTVSDLAGMGVRRISVGGTMARVAMDAFIKSATAIAKVGKFDSFAGIMTNAELNQFFGDDRKNRP